MVVSKSKMYIGKGRSVFNNFVCTGKVSWPKNKTKQNPPECKSWLFFGCPNASLPTAY